MYEQRINTTASYHRKHESRICRTEQSSGSRFGRNSEHDQKPYNKPPSPKLRRKPFDPGPILRLTSPQAAATTSRQEACTEGLVRLSVSLFSPRGNTPWALSRFQARLRCLGCVSSVGVSGSRPRNFWQLRWRCCAD